MYTIWIVMLLIAVAGVVLLKYRRTVALQSADSAIIAVAGVVIMGIGLLSYPIAHHIAQRGAIGGYHQFLNGSLVKAQSETFNCTEDGPCRRSYNCDSYTVMVPVTTTDNKGNSTTTYVPETRYHDCPYATQEFSYSLKDNFGNEYDIADHIFAGKPAEWRRGNELPGDVPRGVPKQWSKAKANIEAGNADPVTVPDTYDNFILADEGSLLRASSDKIELLRKKKLLPYPTANMQDPIHSLYKADKVSFVGVQPDNPGAWQSTLMHFNAALGMQYQGDMHVVIIRASAIPSSVSPEDYLNALKAYWLNDLGKYALAKNGIMLVLAVDDSGTTVQWSKAATGMPIGNGAMLEALSNQLSSQPLSTKVLFGDNTAQITSDGKVQYHVGAGLVSDIVMHRFAFKRACMACKSKADKGQTGFISLSTDIPLSGWGQFWTLLIDCILAAGVLYLAYGLLEGSPTASNDRIRNRYGY